MSVQTTAVNLKRIPTSEGVVQVNIKFGAQNNPFARVSDSYLTCTCGKPGCIHIRNAEAEYRQWKRMQQARINSQYQLDTPADILIRRAEEMLQLHIGLSVPLRELTLVKLGDGDYAVQWGDTDIALRYSGDGWGYCGAQARMITDPEVQALMEVLSFQDGIVVWDWEAQKCFINTVPASAMPSPMDYFSEIGVINSTPTSRFGGIGNNIVRIGEGPRKVEIKKSSPWPAWWVRMSGLELVGSDIWSGSGRVLVENKIDGEQPYGLAFDLARNLVCPLNKIQVSDLTKDIPFEDTARTHLPWGPDGNETAPWQVIVTRKDGKELTRESNLVLRVNNFWEDDQDWYAQAIPLLCRYLIRLGQAKTSVLFYGPNKKNVVLHDELEPTAELPSDHMDIVDTLHLLILNRLAPDAELIETVGHLGLEAFLPPVSNS